MSKYSELADGLEVAPELYFASAAIALRELEAENAELREALTKIAETAAHGRHEEDFEYIEADARKALAGSDDDARECGVCTTWVTADDEGSLDCPNCGAHLESRL